jgi:hypothetical protein
MAVREIDSFMLTMALLSSRWAMGEPEHESAELPLTLWGIGG